MELKLVAAASWCWGWCRSCIAAASCWSSGTAAGLLACVQAGQKAFSLRSWCTGWSCIASRCWCRFACCYCSAAASCLACVQASQQSFSLRGWCTGRSCIANRCWCRCWCTASSRSTAAILLAAENTSRSTRRGRDRTSNNRQSNNQSTHSKFSNNKKGSTTSRVVHSMAAYSLLRVGRSNAARPSMSTRVPSL